MFKTWRRHKAICTVSKKWTIYKAVLHCYKHELEVDICWPEADKTKPKISPIVGKRKAVLYGPHSPKDDPSSVFSRLKPAFKAKQFPYRQYEQIGEPRLQATISRGDCNRVVS